jgi:hypothetical protein
MHRLHAPARSAAALGSGPSGRDDADPLFSSVVGFSRPGRLAPVVVSMGVHIAFVALLVLTPILLAEALIETSPTDVFRALIYDPPPPPPPLLPKGSLDGGRRRLIPEARPTPQPVPVKPETRLEAPIEAVPTAAQAPVTLGIF